MQLVGICSNDFNFYLQKFKKYFSNERVAPASRECESTLFGRNYLASKIFRHPPEAGATQASSKL
jgi:hypothetical protein